MIKKIKEIKDAEVAKWMALSSEERDKKQTILELIFAITYGIGLIVIYKLGYSI